MNQKNRRRKKERKNKRGFSLIEMLVAMFIFVMVMGGMVAVSIAGFRSYGKSKSIKTILEDVGFAVNSITKDVRMGKIENGTGYATGAASDYLLVSRNRGGRFCYKIDSTSISVADIASGSDCTLGTLSYNKIVDLSPTGMLFDNPGTAKFRSCVSDNIGDGSITACNGVFEKRRGWAQINLNIENPSMTSDSIHLETTVSSRDYGWETQ